MKKNILVIMMMRDKNSHNNNLFKNKEPLHILLEAESDNKTTT